jgi:hypothetical protein
MIESNKDNIKVKTTQSININTKKLNNIKIGSITNKHGANYKSLFSNIKDYKSLKKTYKFVLHTDKVKNISRKKGKILNTINGKINSISKSLKKLNISTKNYSKDNLYNEYFSKISNILTKSFNEALFIKGKFKAVVLVTINSNGILDYSIYKKSLNGLFNSELIKFLENMRHRTFPVYKNDTVILKIIFEIKD